MDEHATTIDALMVASDALARRGRHVRALAILRRLLALTPDNVAARLKAAESLKACDRLEEALAQCRRAVRSGDPLVYAAQAELEARLGLRVEARRSLAKLSSQGARSAQASLWAADTCKSLDEFAPARKHFEAAAQAEPDNVRARVGAAELCLASGDTAGALMHATALMNLEDGRTPGLRLRGAAQVMRGRPKDALKDLDRAVEEPPDVQALLWRGEAHRLAGNLDQAKADLGRALGLWPQSLPALINLALVELAQGKTLSAKLIDELRTPVSREVVDLWTEIAPSDPARSAKALRKLLASLKGGRSFQTTYWWGKPRPKIVSHVNFAPRGWLMNVQARLRFGDPDRVLKEFDYLMARTPDGGYACSSRGEVCLWLGRYAEARKLLKRSLVLSPILPYPNIGLAGVCVLAGDYEGARRHLASADRNNASQSAMATWSGELYRKTGEHERALAEFDKSELPFPFRLSLWLNRALALGALGRAARQRSLFRRLLRHAPDLLNEAARMERLAPDPARRSDKEIARILERALAQMRGNRSSWMYTFFDSAGKLRHIRLRGLSPRSVPGPLASREWLFERESPAEKKELDAWPRA